MDEQRLAMNRRRFMAGLSAAGVGSTLLPGALVAVAQDAEEITVEMLAAAQQVAGLQFTTDELQRLTERLNLTLRRCVPLILVTLRSRHWCSIRYRRG